MIKLVLLWSLYASGPGHHAGWDRQIAACSRWAVAQARAANDPPRYVACVLANDGLEDTLRCRASRNAQDALDAGIQAAEAEVQASRQQD